MTAATAATAATSARPLVLAVDDDCVSRDALEVLLSGEGVEVVTCASGPAGLEQARARPPDVVLLDVMMPGMDGFEVCRRIRADASLTDVPVILVTALDDKSSRLTGFEAGADDFVSKPYDRVELRARLRTILRLDRYRRLVSERETFRWVVDNSPSGYLELDAEGDVLYANGAARLFLGLAEGAPARFPACAGAVYRKEPAQAWAAWPGLGEEKVFLVRPEDAHSRAAWLEVRAFARPGDTAGRTLVRLRDVTLEQTALLETDVVRSFVSHKLGTPLNSLLGSLQLLAAGALEPAEVAEFAQLSLASGWKLAERLRRIVETLGRTGPGRMPGILAGEVGSLVSEVAADLALPLAPRVEMDPALGGRRLRIEAATLDWILRELVGNSQKFHPRRSPSVEVRLEAGPVGARLSVSDDGVSLSPCQLAQAVRPFTQSGRSVLGDSEGMGLGLWAVAARLWEVGGDLSLRNRPDGPGLVAELALALDEDAGEA